MFRSYQFKGIPSHLAVQVTKCPRHRPTLELWKAKNDLRNIWKENQLLPYDLRSMFSFNSYVSFSSQCLLLRRTVYMKLEDRKCDIVMYTLVHTVGTKKIFAE